jgi:uncharacterized membrane protein
MSRRVAIAWIVVYVLCGAMWTYFTSSGVPQWVAWTFAVESFLAAALKGWLYFNAPQQMKPPGGIPS